jgi:hypothetical protein
MRASGNQLSLMTRDPVSGRSISRHHGTYGARRGMRDAPVSRVLSTSFARPVLRGMVGALSRVGRPGSRDMRSRCCSRASPIAPGATSLPRVKNPPPGWVDSSYRCSNRITALGRCVAPPVLQEWSSSPSGVVPIPRCGRYDPSRTPAGGRCPKDRTPSICA